MKKRILRLVTTLSVFVVFMIATHSTSFAAVPNIEQIEYEGKGRVEIDFRQDVRYNKSFKVIVKDNKGKKYSVKNIRKDEDEVKFTIKNYKKGRTYKITIKGVKKENTKSYGSITGKMKIPSGAVGKKISSSKAVSIAKSNAKKWGAKSSFWDVDVESDRYAGQAVWEVSFNSGRYEYEYKIAKKGGKILHKEREYDD